MKTYKKFGVWLSLVERLVRDQEAAGSSPVTPTIEVSGFTRVIADSGILFFVRICYVSTKILQNVQETLEFTLISQKYFLNFSPSFVSSEA